MTPIEEFVADPVGFLGDNALRALFTLPAGPSPIRKFKFEAKAYTATRLSDNAAVPCYSLVPHMPLARRINESNISWWGRKLHEATHKPVANRDVVSAYWCPYFDDQYHSTIVDSGADFMFTPNMDGCSFGVGSATTTGARRVAHINLRSQPHSRVLQNATLSVDGLDDHMVKPQRYTKSSKVPAAVPGEIKVTTIGVRDRGTGQWSFHYQQYRLVGGQINQVHLLGVKRV